MTLLKFNKFLAIFSLVLILGASDAFSKSSSSIKELTSRETSEKLENKLPKQTRNPNELQKHSLGIGLGQTFTKEDFKKHGDSEITWDLYYNYSASHSFDLMLNFHSSTHEKGNLESTLSGAAIGIKAKLFNFDNFAPVAFGGLGFYWPTLTRTDLVETESKTVFGYHFGGGAELKLNKNFMTGVLLHIHNPFDVKQENNPEVEGWYYKLLLTAFYTF